MRAQSCWLAIVSNAYMVLSRLYGLPYTAHFFTDTTKKLLSNSNTANAKLGVVFKGKWACSNNSRHHPGIIIGALVVMFKKHCRIQ